MVLQLLPITLAVTKDPRDTWVDSSDSFDLCLTMRQPLIPSFYHTLRIPTATAPWPEPPSPTHTDTFDFFPFLPVSVRQKIWALAAPGPRVIEIQ